MIRNGEDIVAVSRLMGHANASFTFNVYCHMLPRKRNPIGDRLASLVFGNKMETAGDLERQLELPVAENLGQSSNLMVARGGIECSVIKAILAPFPNSENCHYPEGYPGYCRAFSEANHRPPECTVALERVRGENRRRDLISSEANPTSKSDQRGHRIFGLEVGRVLSQGRPD